MIKKGHPLWKERLWFFFFFTENRDFFMCWLRVSLQPWEMHEHPVLAWWGGRDQQVRFFCGHSGVLSIRSTLSRGQLSNWFQRTWRNEGKTCF